MPVFPSTSSLPILVVRKSRPACLEPSRDFDSAATRSCRHRPLRLRRAGLANRRCGTVSTPPPAGDERRWWGFDQWQDHGCAAAAVVERTGPAGDEHRAVSTRLNRLACSRSIVFTRDCSSPAPSALDNCGSGAAAVLPLDQSPPARSSPAEEGVKPFRSADIRGDLPAEPKGRWRQDRVAAESKSDLAPGTPVVICAHEYSQRDGRRKNAHPESVADRWRVLAGAR